MVKTDNNAPMQPADAIATTHDAMQALYHSLRPGQRRMADWQQGPLAVSAVPGSGKSTGLAIATALILAKRYQAARATQTVLRDQLVLVTFTRSAVANLKLKIRHYLHQLAVPATGFVVHTLHGLALNIATRHPDLSNLDFNRMTLVAPNQGNRLIRTAVEQWIATNPLLYQQLLEGQQFDGEETERLRRQSVLRTEILPDLTYTVVHEAKSSGLTPAQLRQISQETVSRVAAEMNDYQVLAIAAGLYETYQTLLLQRNFIDYDDMILAALRVLDNDAARSYWQSQVFAVFEDEAQDSSPLQTRLLEVLATDPADAASLNLVRVGDPNQAINSTFTPADPLFFRTFCRDCQLQGRLAQMDQAGRSSPIILAAANAMLTWVNQFATPVSTAGAPPALPFRRQMIRPVDADDPQPQANPQPVGTGLEIRFPHDIFHSVELIANRVVELMHNHPDGHMAVLVRENRQGQFISEVLQNPTQYNLSVNLEDHGISIYEVGQRDRQSHIPSEMLAMLQFLDRPHSPDNLKAALKVMVDRKCIPTQDLNALTSLPEQFLYPGPLDPPQTEPVLHARDYCTNLLRARLQLPHYQLIPFLASKLNYDPSELATADKLAARIAQQTSDNASMASLLLILNEMVSSESFEAVETENPEARYSQPKQLTIITMHKAKGLDWDFVFIPFLQDSTIPGRLWVPPQTQFLGNFNLAEVARAQIRAFVHQEPNLPTLELSWHRAEQLKIAEEYRLLYVAMTRAKRLLWMAAEKKAPFSWSNPSNLDDKPATPVLIALSQQFAP